MTIAPITTSASDIATVDYQCPRPHRMSVSGVCCKINVAPGHLPSRTAAYR